MDDLSACRFAATAAKCASIEDLARAALFCVDGRAVAGAGVWSRFGQGRWHLLAGLGSVPDSPPEGAEEWQVVRTDSRRRTTVVGVTPAVLTQAQSDLLCALVEAGVRRLDAEAAADAALQAGEQRLATILDASPDAVVVIALDGEVLHANLRAGDVFGYDLGELVGQPVEMLVPDSLREGHRDHRRTYAAAPTSRSMAVGRDLRALHRDGTEIPVDIALEPMEVHGRSAVAAFIRDATARRQAEDQRQQLAREEMARQQAMELNDNVVQGLTSAIWLLELEELEAGLHASRETLASAQAMMADLMGQLPGDIGPATLQRARPAPSTGAVPLRPATEPVPATEGRLRTVVVDDSEDIRALLTMQLERAGIDVVAAVGDGYLALDAVDRHRPDAVVMDLSMPGLDGLRATEQLRERHPDLRIVVLSGHPRDVMLDRALAAGANAYLQKGSHVDMLVEVLQATADPAGHPS